MEASGSLVQGLTGNACVYTTLIGQYERLNEQPVAARSSYPFICLTDDPDLRSESWECRLVAPLFPMDPVRSQRDLKIRPHLYLSDYDASLYIDNSVILKSPPERFFELSDADTGFVLPRHSYRESVLDEFLAVSQLGFDDDGRIFEQLNHYLLSMPGVLDETPWWAAIMLRDHRDARVRAMLEVWASHVKRYSRRDQLSVNFAFRTAGFQPSPIEIDNLVSELHSWPHADGRDRQRGMRKLATSLMPGSARIRLLEQQLEASQRALAERCEALETAQRALSERESELAEAQRARQQREAELEAGRAVLAERDRVLDEAQRAQRAREEELETVRMALAERAEQIESARTALETLLGSPSWRVTSPMRWISSRVFGTRAEPDMLSPGDASSARDPASR